MLFVGQHGLTCKSWEADGKQSNLRQSLSKHPWQSQGWKLNIQSNLLTALSIRTCFLLNSLLKSWSVHHTLDEVQNLHTGVFFTADTPTPKGAPYKLNRQALVAENWGLAVIADFRPVINLPCSDLVFFLQSPFLQWCRSIYLRSFMNISTRTRGCNYMGSFVLLMSSSCLEATQLSLFITLLFGLLITSGCTTWTPFGWRQMLCSSNPLGLILLWLMQP